MDRARGTVKWFNELKMNGETPDPKSNYGFIILPGSAGEAFVHGNDVRPESYPLCDRQIVEFELVQGKKGFRAVDVAIVAPKTELPDGLG